MKKDIRNDTVLRVATTVDMLQSDAAAGSARSRAVSLYLPCKMSGTYLLIPCPVPLLHVPECRCKPDMLLIFKLYVVTIDFPAGAHGDSSCSLQHCSAPRFASF